jgi:hypothetical protein
VEGPFVPSEIEQRPQAGRRVAKRIEEDERSEDNPFDVTQRAATMRQHCESARK